MPTYDLRCIDENCLHEEEMVLSINYERGSIECPKCKKSKMIQVFKQCDGGFIFKGEPPVGKQVKVKREAEKLEQIASEPLTATEINELPQIAAEEEKKKGLEPNSILGGRKAVMDKAGKERIAKRDLKKKEESIKQRKKLGLK